MHSIVLSVFFCRQGASWRPVAPRKMPFPATTERNPCSAMDRVLAAFLHLKTVTDCEIHEIGAENLLHLRFRKRHGPPSHGCLPVRNRHLLMKKRRRQNGFSSISPAPRTVSLFYCYCFCLICRYFSFIPSLKAFPTFSPSFRYALFTGSNTMGSSFAGSIFPFSSKIFSSAETLTISPTSLQVSLS
jgi:hypothetical protein